MKQYLNLLQDILENGHKKEDRTGTGTISSFGKQLRFDLSEGKFPLVTTKKMFTRGVIEELLWMLRGSVDVKELQAKKVHIWDSWVDEEGTIGHGYGKQFRNIERYTPVEPYYKDYVPFENEFDNMEQVEYVAKRAMLNLVHDGFGLPGQVSEKLIADWLTIMEVHINTVKGEPCQDNYPDFHVAHEWHTLIRFIEDVQKVPGWELFLEHPEEYDLSFVSQYATNVICKRTASWVTKDVHDENWRLMLVGKDHLRYDKYDQLKSLVAGLKHNPRSRRHLISLWDAVDMNRSTLFCCHGTAIQFNVRDLTEEESKKFGKKMGISLMMTQRSNDLLLGNPFNVSFYSLFLLMVAQVTDYAPLEFIMSIGDAHIYSNHIEQVELQLTRTPFELPTIKINPEVKSIFDFKTEDFEIIGYESHPAIKADVAV